MYQFILLFTSVRKLEMLQTFHCCWTSALDFLPRSNLDKNHCSSSNKSIQFTPTFSLQPRLFQVLDPQCSVFSLWSFNILLLLRKLHWVRFRYNHNRIHQNVFGESTIFLLENSGLHFLLCELPNGRKCIVSLIPIKLCPWRKPNLRPQHSYYVCVVALSRNGHSFSFH